VTIVTATAEVVCEIYVGSLDVKDGQKLTEILRAELRFVEEGGYRRKPRFPFRPNFIFEDSPTCFRVRREGEETGTPLCRECQLMSFVPEDSREKRFPCRHIDLTGQGETINSFYEYGTEEELETALAGWLKRKIGELDGEGEEHEQAQGA
jgi:hypothetical protein